MSRRGISLIEMLVAITVSTALMGLAVSTLYMLMRVGQNGRDHVGQAMIVPRLADQFRSDVHAALRPITADGSSKNQWRFALPKDCTVTYQVLPGEMERRQQVAGKLVRQESYVLPAHGSAEIVLRTDSTPATASLVITSPGPGSSPGREIRIDAALGTDYRFTKTPSGSP
jgi:type II secretory pathway component PulJ